MRPAVRLAALMGLPVTYVWTHDSIGLGEDGQTHQPVEHVAALRAIPGLDVVRPADAEPDRGRLADRPGTSRDAAAACRPVLDPAERSYLSAGHRWLRAGRRRGSRRVRARGRGRRRRTRLSSHRHGVGGAARRCGARHAQPGGHPGPGGVDAVQRVVPARGSGIPRRRAAAERAGSGLGRGGGRTGLARAARRRRRSISLEHFGASADYKTLFREFGITAEAVAMAAKDSIAAAGG